MARASQRPAACIAPKSIGSSNVWGLIWTRYGGALWKAILVIAILVSGAIYLHARDQSFVRQGEARVQAKWDAQSAQIAKQAAAQMAASRTIEAQNRARNAEVINDLANKLDAVVADRNRIYQRLRALTAPAADHPGSVSESGVSAGSVPKATNAGDATLDGLLADALAECQSNAARQNAMMDSLGLR